jgi:threonine dehydrogenase-like Zn-dependent dehydrogenase
LLVRHDAVGLCGSDVHVIRAGQDHPNIYRDMRARPVVLGHEVALTVVAVGENLNRYQPGNRFVVQADIFAGGVRYAYGYEIQGGLSQFNILDQRVLNGDGGSYLLPLEPATGYAEAALTEPWACVEAAYRIQYRAGWKEGGTVLIAGRGQATGWEDWSAGTVYLFDVSPSLAERVHSWAAARGIKVSEDQGETAFDDVLVLSTDAEMIETMARRLADGGILNIVADEPVDRPVAFDVGRVHYDRITVIGTLGPDVRPAYQVRSTLRKGGTVWVLGAAGPSGQMHIVHAMEIGPQPRQIVATNLRSARIQVVAERLASTAAATGIELVCLTEHPLGTEAFHQRLWAQTKGRGFDDIVVLAPSASAITSAADLLAPGGVLNLYAGVPRGTMVSIDVSSIIQRGIRLIGSSGSSIADMQRVLEMAQSGAISTNPLVSAIGSLEAAVDGLRAVAAGQFAGKVVIYPQIPSLPLTPLSDLQDVLPDVYAKLGDGQTWTVEAEKALLGGAPPST